MQMSAQTTERYVCAVEREAHEQSIRAELLAAQIAYETAKRALTDAKHRVQIAQDKLDELI